MPRIIRAPRAVRNRVLFARPIAALVAAGSLTLGALPARAEDAPKPALTLDAVVIVDTLVAASGDARGARTLARADLKLNYDGASAGHPGLTAMVDLAAYTGHGFTRDVTADLQGVSSIEAPAAIRPVNAWVQWSGAHAAIKAGVIDTNADFDEQNVAALFLNASHGMGPELSHSGLNGAGAAPFSALGAIAFLYDASAGLKLRAGLFGGRPGDPAHPARWSWAFGSAIGSLAIAEADWTGKRLRLAAGAWRFSTPLPRADAPDQAARDTAGAFALAEGALLFPRHGPTLDGWVRVGFSDRRTSPVTAYLGGGLVLKRLRGLPEDDALGIAFARATRNPRFDPAASAETAIELTARHKLNPHWVIQPDLQYVTAPGGVRDRPAATVVGLRLIGVR